MSNDIKDIKDIKGKMQFYYKNNNFFNFLFITKKYRELYNSWEAFGALLLAIISSLFFYFIYNVSKIDEFNEIIRNITSDLTAGLIGVLGFIVGSLAILSGTIGSKALKSIDDNELADSIIGILFSFYFVGAIIGVNIICQLFMYLSSYLPLNANNFNVIYISIILSYLFWFVILYSIALLGTTLKMFLINYLYTEMPKNKIKNSESSGTVPPDSK